MKKILLLLIIATGTSNIHSQAHEIYGGAGFANYYGDLNTNNASSSFFSVITEMDIKYAHASYGFGYRYNFTNLFSIGIGGQYFVIDGADRRNNENLPGQKNFPRYIRNLSFQNNIIQGILDARVEPWRIQRRWTSGNFLFSPYIGAGVSLFHHNPKTLLNGTLYELQQYGTEGQGAGRDQKPYALTQFGIPLSLGAKLIPGSRMFSFNLNFSYTFTFTDYLDDVSTVYADPSVLSSPTAIALADRRPEIDPSGLFSYATAPGQIRGHKRQKDNFITGQIQFSWYFNQATSAPYYDCCNF